MAKTLDLAVTEETDGRMMLHRADCPHARKLAAEGQPVLTMLDCRDSPFMNTLPHHDCLKTH